LVLPALLVTIQQAATKVVMGVHHHFLHMQLLLEVEGAVIGMGLEDLVVLVVVLEIGVVVLEVLVLEILVDLVDQLLQQMVGEMMVEELMVVMLVT
jgi:hypothetical protein